MKPNSILEPLCDPGPQNHADTSRTGIFVAIANNRLYGSNY